MQQTNAQIAARCRQILGDTEVAGGQIFTDAFLLANYTAPVWSALLAAGAAASLDLSVRESTVRLLANQKILNPYGRQAGIPNLSQINSIYSASIGVESSLPLSPAPTVSADGWVNLQPTSTTGFNTGDTVHIVRERRVDGWVNNEWTINLAGGVVTLVGCDATIRSDDYSTALPGWIVKRSTEFREIGRQMANVLSSNSQAQAQAPIPGPWRVDEGGLIRFTNAPSSTCLLRIVYRQSATGTSIDPDAGIPWDDAGEWMANWMAYLVAKDRMSSDFAFKIGSDACGVQADGRSIVPDGNGGMLLQFINNQSKSQPPQSSGRYRVKNRAKRCWY